MTSTIAILQRAVNPAIRCPQAPNTADSAHQSASSPLTTAPQPALAADDLPSWSDLQVQGGGVL